MAGQQTPGIMDLFDNPVGYSKVWFNTPELAPAQIKHRLQKFGVKPDGIINFLSNEPPFELTQC
jgi:hypothetical protein